MKRLINISLLSLAVVLTMSFACNQGSSTESKKKSSMELMNIDGFEVILKHRTNEVVSARYYIKGGTANYSKAQEGIENLAFGLAATGGTTETPKDEFNGLVEKYGTAINGNSSYDTGEFSLQCVKLNWDASWDLFAQAILSPALDPDEFDRQKQQMISAVKQNETDPDGHIRQMALENSFKDGNYAKKANGSIESLEDISLADITKYLPTVMSRSQNFLVVVGDISKEDLTEKVEALIADLPEGDYKNDDLTPLTVEESNINIEQRDIATNYMRALMSAPAQGTKEATIMQVAMNILSDRYFDEIRTKRSLSYAPGAFFAGLNHPYSAMVVSTTDPNQSAEVMLDELVKIKSEGFDAIELRDKKETFLTFHYMGQETNAAQSATIGSAHIQGGIEMVDSFVDDVYAISLDELNSTFNKYINGVSWSYLGDKSLVDETIFLKDINETTPVEGQETIQ